MAKVLIVDDEKSIRLTLQAFLRSEGHEVETAPDVNGARAILAGAAFDVVVSDIVLPGASGVELLAEIRETAPDVHVIMMTGEPTVETAVQAVRAGAVDYLVKPVPRSAIVKIVGNTARMKTLEDEKKRLEKANLDYLAQLERQNAELKNAAKFREEVELLMRHDLKSPLSAVIGTPRLVEMAGEINEKQAEYLRRIEHCGRRMLDMIGLSLDLFRMEQGMYEFRPLPVDVRQVLDDAIRHQESLARARDVSVETRIDGRPAASTDEFLVQGERLLFYSLLSNLLKNAIEASPANETVIATLQSGGNVRGIAVRNKGPVPPEIRDRFFQKHVTFGKAGGTGLGAYSARLITEAQGGSIRLDSSKDDETTIVLLFPETGGNKS